MAREGRLHGGPAIRDPALPGGATGPDGAWSPENPSPATGSALSGLTEERQVSEYANSSVDVKEQTAPPVNEIGHDRELR